MKYKIFKIIKKDNTYIFFICYIKKTVLYNLMNNLVYIN